MRLKRVRILGFKTFADRTEVNLDGGIVAVVGPNGCGKSNLVDAILWALGESNARRLRAATGQDVIFNGSARRRPVGFAEVTLYFDNEDGSLPVDTSEVAITRRLTRGGESDYLINHRICRQRDVHELLADSGLGRAGYSIVSQKEIDQALAASPEDRRAWIDEAAGVQRYRLRKTESLKRLESAGEHLIRVDDILRELEAQRGPLRQEAELARRYKSASEALRAAETGLLIRDLTQAVREVAVLEQRLGASLAVVRSEHERAQRLDLDAENLRLSVEAADHKMDGLRHALNESSAATERADSRIRLAEERMRSLDQLEQTLQSGDLHQAVGQAEKEMTACKGDELAEEGTLIQARRDVGGVGDEANNLAERLAHAEANLAEGRRTEILRLKLQAELDHRLERRKLAQRELLGVQRDLPNLLSAREGAGKASEAALLRFSDAEAALKQCESALTELRLQEDALGGQSRGLLAERAALEGRKRGIEATIQAHEGLAQGSRAVVDAFESGQLNGYCIPLGEAIRTSPAYANALEIALGASVHDLFVDDEATAQAAIGFLSAQKLGRATFLPISSMAGQPHVDKSLAGQSGVVGWAGDLITVEQKLHGPVESILGGVLIVDTLETAFRIREMPGWASIVTLGGEIFFASGALAGGHSGKPHGGLLQRRADLVQIDADIQELSAKIEAIADQLAQAGGKRQALLSDSAIAKLELTDRGAELTEAKEFFRTLSSELHAAEKSHDKLTKEIEGLTSETAMPPAGNVELLQSERDALINEFAARSADAEQAKRRLVETEGRLSQARQRTASAAKRLEAIHHSELQRVARLESLEPERQRFRIEIEKHRQEASDATDCCNHLRVELESTQAEKDRLITEGLRCSEEAKAVRANVAALAEANHQDELSQARAEARRAIAAERLFEEYGVTEDVAIAQEGSIAMPADAQTVATRLRREIKAMGDVNTGAIEAYERVAARHEELSAQRADIMEGIGQVRAGIVELDKLTRDRFLDTFARVESAYAEMFVKLLGGGEGQVFLDNPTAILDSGIGIEITLPGKKRQRLELLSGGERALCATAFLFALLAVKPSPLVVLDEVDAPLDGRNVERFADLLQEFTDRTQFIVITHNPATIERAPVWLGVTMQEPGVSTLVPARLPSSIPRPPSSQPLILLEADAARMS